MRLRLSTRLREARAAAAFWRRGGRSAEALHAGLVLIEGFPSSAAGLLAEPDTARPTDGALARLIGRTRAQLLAELERPATTTQLCRCFDLSLGVVGHHLAALRAAALVTRTRFGQSVVYELTPLGSALLEANPEKRVEDG